LDGATITLFFYCFFIVRKGGFENFLSSLKPGRQRREGGWSRERERERDFTFNGVKGIVL
jgi:hypothetical protein